MAKQSGKRKKDGAKADATEGLPPLNLHAAGIDESGTPISWRCTSTAGFAPAGRRLLAACKAHGGRSCYSFWNKVWIFTRPISRRFKHAMNALTGN